MEIKLTKEKMALVIFLISAIGIVGIYFVVFAPLIKQTSETYLKCSTIEDEVLKVRSIIKAAGEIEGRRVLVTEEEVSYINDEFTRYGKSKGVDFISIDPGEIQKEKGSDYKVLPVEIEMESTYKQLGAFLGSLDDLEKGLVTVEGFSIVPDPDDATKLITELTVNIYLSGRGNNNSIRR